VWPHVPMTGCTAAVPPCIIRVNPDGRWCAHPFKCDRMVRKRLRKDVVDVALVDSSHRSPGYRAHGRLPAVVLRLRARAVRLP
jgi:hypothetical protein